MSDRIFIIAVILDDSCKRFLFHSTIDSRPLNYTDVILFVKSAPYSAGVGLKSMTNYDVIRLICSGYCLLIAITIGMAHSIILHNLSVYWW